MMRKCLLAAVIGIAAGLGLVWVFRKDQEPVPHSTDHSARLLALAAEVRQAQKEADLAVAAYRPKSTGKIDDLTSPALAILEPLPGVISAQVPRPGKQPSHRIIHVRDWHFVPKELYAIDLKEAYKRPLSQDEFDQFHQELLLQVELVQIDQMTLLRCLIKHHGLRRVFAEGLTAEMLAHYKDQITGLGVMEKGEIPQLRRQLEEVRILLDGMEQTDKKKPERFTKAKALESEIEELLDQHRVRLLEVGAAGRLLLAGEIEEVLPLDNAGLLDLAQPVSPSGKVVLDRSKIMAREDAQVGAALKYGPCAVIVLGGSHNLAGSVDRLAKGACEYIRLTTKRYQEFAGK